MASKSYGSYEYMSMAGSRLQAQNTRYSKVEFKSPILCSWAFADTASLKASFETDKLILNRVEANHACKAHR